MDRRKVYNQPLHQFNQFASTPSFSNRLLHTYLQEPVLLLGVLANVDLVDIVVELARVELLELLEHGVGLVTIGRTERWKRSMSAFSAPDRKRLATLTVVLDGLGCHRHGARSC